jgi:hypothetical protein
MKNKNIFWLNDQAIYNLRPSIFSFLNLFLSDNTHWFDCFNEIEEFLHDNEVFTYSSNKLIGKNVQITIDEIFCREMIECLGKKNASASHLSDDWKSRISLITSCLNNLILDCISAHNLVQKHSSAPANNNFSHSYHTRPTGMWSFTDAIK